MPKTNIICLGKLKESYWREAEAEYLKRLKPFTKIEIRELKEEAFGEKDSPETIKQKEADKILNALPKTDDFIIALDEHGKQFSSTELAKQLSQTQTRKNITFIIGGPLGLHSSVRQKADLELSLSPLTFTHQMCRVFLLEQIYRALMINGGRKYHY
ncbi:23S rRNA (pseudouridine(1915)-N(3))-methyltransferase RlmH [Patescibacteria group bacterium]|nr:MAG: 23S rRNA (pseudouridine(1915)-N(3))-methyltransferase RlmH [Patescibacteria group bacterium]